MEHQREVQTTEHSLSVERLKMQMIELKQDHILATEESRREHEDMVREHLYNKPRDQVAVQVHMYKQPSKKHYLHYVKC